MSLKLSRRFGFSTRSLGHVMFSFAGTAQEAGAGGRSGAAGNPGRGSLMGRFSYIASFTFLLVHMTVDLWLALWDNIGLDFVNFALKM